MRNLLISLAFVGIAASAEFASAQARCPAWSSGETSFDAPVRAMAVFDDGNGPALYVGGDFRTVGGRVTRRIAKWDGVAWTEVGGGVTGPVYALAVLDSGSGPALYVAGDFGMAGHLSVENVARWNGRSWSTVGRGFDRPVLALAVFDAGGGPRLFAGGEFVRADQRLAISIATWSGTAWSSVADGLNGTVRALTTFDDGTGVGLYAGGDFRAGGTVPAARVARWNGSAWSAVGLGMNNTVRALLPYDDGSGPRLYAGGDFTLAGNVGAARIASFDGTAWSRVGSGFSGAVHALAVHDDGRGPALFAGGSFVSTLDPSPALRIARWDGAAWSALGGGMNDTVLALASYDSGSVGALAAGGPFSVAGAPSTRHLALWLDPCALALRGTVNAGAGPGANTDTLFVADSSGGRERRVVLANYQPFNIFVASPPAAIGPAPFALFAWIGEPSPATLRSLPYGLGTTAFPTPLSAGGPAPRAIFNNTGRSILGASTRPSTPAPSLVLSLPAGAGRSMVFTLQAIIADRASSADVPASVTNGVIVDIR